MLFTENKDRFYETFMQEKPKNNKGTHPNNQRCQPFRYNYADMNCEYCMYYKNCKCDICPEIMENLDDLLFDNSFFLAVEYADQCKSAHKNTLMKLKEYFEEKDDYAGI